MATPIYLDYAATTPVDPRVAARMAACLTADGVFGNPASLHPYGQQARALVETAREQVAALINAEPQEIIFTSGATESDNLAIKGAAKLYKQKGRHIVTMKTEHKAVLDACQHLEKEGYEVTYLAPEKNGLLAIEKLTAALRSDTTLVSIMQVNNETGVVQNIDAIAAETSKRHIILHVDAAQSTGKMAVDVKKAPIDLMSLAAHKVYGPKGIGALYLRKKPRVRVEALIHGGGHEQGMRSGTLPTHQIVGMGEAYRIAGEEWQRDRDHVAALRDVFLQKLQEIKQLKLNTDLNECVPHILNVCFNGMLAEAVLAQLPDIATSTASACQGKGTEGSYVLRAMGFGDEEAKSSVRFSFGRFTTKEEVEQAAHTIGTLFRG